MKIFQCRKCYEFIEAPQRPAAPMPCPAGHQHVWDDVGECGDVAYYCRKCGKRVSVIRNRVPLRTPCPKGHQHDWTKVL